MAFSYSASTRLSVVPPSSSSQPIPQQLRPNPQIQHHQYLQPQQLLSNPQIPAQLIDAMDESSRTSSSSSSYQQQQQQQEYYHPSQPSQQSPRPLQGPRPAPLKVRKDSYKIKKPPVAPGAHHHRPSQQQQLQNQQQLPRQPVIIYTVSPKVIHAKPGDFMSLVQRLTGVNSSPTAAAAAAAESQPSPGAFPSPGPAGAMSPAARLATIERVHQQSAAEHHHHPYRSLSSSAAAAGGGDDLDSLMIEQLDPSSAAATAVLDYRSGSASLPFAPPAILSPNPSSLPGISPSFFASGDLNSLGLFQDFLSGLSPMVGAAAAVATATSAALPAPSPPPPPSPPPAPVTSRGGFIDNSFLLSPTSGSHLAFASSLLAASPGGLWPSGLGFTPNAGAPSPSWDFFGSFPDL